MAQAKSDAQLAEEVDVRSSRVLRWRFVMNLALMLFDALVYFATSMIVLVVSHGTNLVTTRLLHACGGGVPPACVRRQIPAQHVATQGWLHCLGGDLRAEFHHSVQHILLHGLPHLVDCVGGGNDRSLHRARHSHQ